jgi:hypothetical protein
MSMRSRRPYGSKEASARGRSVSLEFALSTEAMAALAFSVSRGNVRQPVHGGIDERRKSTQHLLNKFERASWLSDS